MNRRRASRPGLLAFCSDRIGVLQGWTGIRSRWLALLVTAHVLFGLVRFPAGAIVKRASSLREFHQLGAVGWHFRHADEETKRIVAWLVDSVPEDQVVAFDGSAQGQLQLLAPLLFPRLLVHASSVRDGRDTGGRAVFQGRAPWLSAGGEGSPVVIGGRWDLRLDYR